MEACGVCSDRVKSDDKAVTCDGCNKWYHISCGKISQAVYKSIRDAPENKPINWNCKTCKENQRKRKKGRNLGDISNSSGKEDILDAANSTDFIEGEQTSVPIQDNTVLQATLEKNNRLEKKVNELYEELEKISLQLIRAKEENIKLNLDIIDKTNTIVKLNQEIKSKQYQEPSIPKRQIGTQNTGQPTQLADRELQRQETIGDKQGRNDVGHAHVKTKVLIIGDSLIKGIPQYIKSNAIATKIMPGARIQEVSKFISTATELPDIVVLHIGTNNIKTAKTPNHVMRPLWYTIEAAQKKFKNTIWIVHGILYRKDQTKESVDEVNDALRFMCDQLKVV